MDAQKTPPESNKIIWALTDDRAGNNSQVLGVAEKLGLPFYTKPLLYNFWARLPNILQGAGARHVRGKERSALTAPWPDIVISAGRRSALVARWIKQQNPSTFICSIMGPDGGETEFDLIALPEHDRKLDPEFGTPLTPPANHFYSIAAPHPLNRAKLDAAKEQWAHLFENKPHPHIAVLVGGSTRHAHFTQADYVQLSESLARIRNASGGTLFITTSRRTSEEGFAALSKYLFSDDVIVKWKPGMTADENPYLAFLGSADAVIVTADSVSMCSEALSTGKPVFIYSADEENIAPKFQRFLIALYRGRFARGLSVPLELDVMSTTIPDAAKEIASAILKAHSTGQS